MDYVKQLRSLVGHMPVIMASAGVILRDKANRILLIRHAVNGAWGVPGGMVEPGESLEETARREVHEETGLRVGSMSLLGVFSGPELYYCYPNGDEVYFVSVVYVSDDFDGIPDTPDGEAQEVQFFDPDKLPQPISPPNQPILRKYAEAVLRQ